MRRAVVVFTAALLVVAGLVPGATARPSNSRPSLPALAAAPNDALTGALEAGELSPAEYALHRARSLFRLGEVRDEFGDVARSDPHAATLILRDLFARVSSLDGAERAEAEAILARPNQGGPDDGYLEYNSPDTTIDTTNFRIHYVTSGQHAATPAYAQTIADIMEEVWAREVTTLGWRPPVSDAGWNPNGGNAKFDVYLGDVGADSLYGYCQPDEGQPMGQELHSYCVLDDDFSVGQFPGTNGIDAAKVTAAHEFNHAIQFAYDYTDDFWMLEATATWMEDMVYPTIKDNLQYLRSSSISSPQTPADTHSFSGFQYGQFVWMRYLHERFGDTAVRTVWDNTTLADAYSLTAIEALTMSQGSDFASSFAEFAAWNTKPSRFYDEGVGYETSTTSKRNRSHTLSGDMVGGATISNVDHLSSRNISFKPGAGVAPTDVITLSVDLGPRDMQRATVVSIAPGTQTVQNIPLVLGQGELTVPFGDQTEVVLVMSNASNKMNNCVGWTPGSYSCGGDPADDDRIHKYAGVIGTDAAEPGTGDGGSGGEPPSVTNFNASPNPFFPECKCRKKTTKIRFTLGDPAAVTLDLYRGSRHLGWFVQDQNLDPDTWMLEWDGKLGTRKAREATYTIKLTAVGSDGTTVKKTKVELRR